MHKSWRSGERAFDVRDAFVVGSTGGDVERGLDGSARAGVRGLLWDIRCIRSNPIGLDEDDGRRHKWITYWDKMIRDATKMLAVDVAGDGQCFRSCLKLCLVRVGVTVV